MTLEEAIKRLKEIDIRDALQEDYDALYMAIEALKQEPKIKKVIKMRDATPEERESVDKYVKSISKPTGVNFWDLEQEPKTRWIPVSERLPKEAYGCLVTVLDTNVITQEEFENILPYFVGYDGETWNDADGNICPFEVIAWMPLPESYKAESEEEDKKMKNEQMNFPKTWEEYEQEYGFNDSEEVYTNNSRLIPSFRVKQWLDHLPQLCDDAISRQAVLDLIEHYNSDGLGSVFYGYQEGIKFADAVNKLPPVTPQPKTGHWISFGVQGEVDGQIVKAFTCSECGAISLFRMIDGKIVNGDSCPNCKAKMEVNE